MCSDRSETDGTEILSDATRQRCMVCAVLDSMLRSVTVMDKPHRRAETRVHRCSILRVHFCALKDGISVISRRGYPYNTVHLVLYSHHSVILPALDHRGADRSINGWEGRPYR